MIDQLVKVLVVHSGILDHIPVERPALQLMHVLAEAVGFGLVFHVQLEALMVSGHEDTTVDRGTVDLVHFARIDPDDVLDRENRRSGADLDDVILRDLDIPVGKECIGKLVVQIFQGHVLGTELLFQRL